MQTSTIERYQNEQPGLAQFSITGSSRAAAAAPAAALPIWLAVLMATDCQARSDNEHHDVRWDCVAGRAVYTNSGVEPERIEPLGISLPVGQTLAVYWTPGETAYTLEVYPQVDLRH
jgi:hypothetical protein